MLCSALEVHVCYPQRAVNVVNRRSCNTAAFGSLLNSMFCSSTADANRLGAEAASVHPLAGLGSLKVLHGGNQQTGNYAINLGHTMGCKLTQLPKTLSYFHLTSKM